MILNEGLKFIGTSYFDSYSSIKNKVFDLEVLKLQMFESESDEIEKKIEQDLNEFYYNLSKDFSCIFSVISEFSPIQFSDLIEAYEQKNSKKTDLFSVFYGLKYFENFLNELQKSKTRYYKPFISESIVIDFLFHFFTVFNVLQGYLTIKDIQDKFLSKKIITEAIYQEGDIIDIQIVNKEIVETQENNTICLNCLTVCHENCTLNCNKGAIGHKDIKNCAVFDKNTYVCTKCIGNCSYKYHGYYNIIIADKVEMVKIQINQEKIEEKLEIYQTELEKILKNVRETEFFDVFMNEIERFSFITTDHLQKHQNDPIFSLQKRQIQVLSELKNFLVN